MNSYIGMKLALTEDEPTIRPYFEDRWGNLPDSQNGDIEMSLILLAALHERWVYMLRCLSSTDLSRTFIHPEMETVLDIDTTITLYAWHGKHHVAHVTALKTKMEW